MTTSTLNIRLIPSVQYAVPTTGGTVNVNNNGTVKLLLNPTGSLLALTVNLPSAPENGDSVTLASSQIVTTLSMTGGTIIGPLTSLAVGTFVSYIFNSDSGQWFRSA